MARTWALGLLAMVACAGAGQAQRAEPSPAAERPQASAPAPEASAPPTCPMELPYTTATLSDAPQGPAITFTTVEGQVEELRRRVHALAASHNRQRWGDAAPPGTGSGGEAQAGASAEADAEEDERTPPPPSRATVEVVDRGARLVLAAEEPAHADRLRRSIQARADYMRRRDCDMAHRASAL